MRAYPFIIASFALLLATQIGNAQSNAITSGFGVSAGASTASSCPSFCTGDFEFGSDGGEFSLSANSSESTFGTARSQGFYDSSSTFLPTLKAFSEANSFSGAAAQVTGIQGYSYDGPGTKNVTIDFDLDAIITQGTGSPDSRAAARVAAYFDDGGSYITSFGTLLFESGATILDESSAFLDSSGAADGSISFAVNSGQNFYVIAQLSVDAERGGITDAENTFTASFVDATGLTAVAGATAVPEPSSAALVGLGIVGLFTRRRR